MSVDIIDERRINEITARINAASPGPWKAMLEGRDHMSGSSCITMPTGGIDIDGASDADIEFIANAREDVPYLVSEIKRLAALLQ